MAGPGGAGPLEAGARFRGGHERVLGALHGVGARGEGNRLQRRRQDPHGVGVVVGGVRIMIHLQLTLFHDADLQRCSWPFWTRYPTLCIRTVADVTANPNWSAPALSRPSYRCSPVALDPSIPENSATMPV